MVYLISKAEAVVWSEVWKCIRGGSHKSHKGTAAMSVQAPNSRPELTREGGKATTVSSTRLSHLNGTMQAGTGG